MATVREILDHIQSIAPLHMKESWDNVGLNCGHMDAPVSTVLVALDPFMEVCREAKEVGAQLLLTHHTLIWEPGFVTDQTAWGRSALYLIENGIAHINAHTNMDCAPGGVNDQLAQRLGIENVSIIDPKGPDDRGRIWGLLRRGEVREQSLEAFLEQVKASLGCKGLKYVDGGKPVRTVAVGGGACASELELAARAGCDTFVTADVKYNGFWDAKELGISIIDAGHFHTENPVTAYMARSVQAAFPEITVKISESHTDCANFF